MAEYFNFDFSSTLETTLITADSTANTKGSWTTLGTADSDFAGIEIAACNATYWRRHLYDIRIGGSNVALENCFVQGHMTTAKLYQRFFIPYSGSNGDTIEGRMQSITGSDQIRIHGRFVKTLPYTPANVCSSYGANTATTQGTVVDPGGTANTEGSVVELTTSGGLDHDTDYLLFTHVHPWTSLTNTTFRTLNRIYVDATGSTATGIEWLWGKTLNALYGDIRATGFYVDRSVFKAGTRVWISGQCNQDIAIDRDFATTMHAYQIRPPQIPTLRDR